MKVAVTGSSGTIGRALTAAFEGRGDDVLRLVRRPPAPGEPAVEWDPGAGVADPAALEGLDAVVHLAGEPLASGFRWTRARMARIRSSRADGTRVLAESLAGLERPPGALVSASAVGFYGDRGDELLDEESAPGSGFLADVSAAWEAATAPAAKAGVRVVNSRFGVVVSRDSPLIARQLPLYRLGLGGRTGSGRQWMPWIALADAVGAILHVLDDDSVAGPVNFCAPQPTTNREFASALARAVRRPALGWLPAIAARLAFGRMADELMLSSQRVRPTRLLDTGYEFRYPELDGAIRAALNRE